MESATKKKVFISYVEEDGSVAHEIAAGLEAKGYSTWYYERDCPLGADYFEETFRAVSLCDALVMVISPRSVQSDQITREVVRGAETCKTFLPLLLEISHEEYCRRRPGWRQAMGAANSVRIPSAGVAAIVPALVEGLKARGIQPDGAAPQVTPPDTAEMKPPAAGGATPASAAPQVASTATGTKIVILYKRDAHPDEELLQVLESALAAQGHAVFIDRHMRAGTQWLLELESQIRSAHAVIPLLSAESVNSEMLSWEVETAREAAQQQKGKPYLIPVRVDFEGPLTASLAPILDPIQYAMWKSPQDSQRLLGELIASLRNPPAVKVKRLESTGGVVPLDSEFYIVRPGDQQFYDALARRDSIVRIKGARQMGKTSLLARGLQQARSEGARVVVTDFQRLNADDLANLDLFYRALADLIADELDIDFNRDETWKPGRPENLNFERFMKREVLAKSETPLVWGMDEVDRLFTCDFATEVFGLVRSWFNARSLSPEGPWKLLTIVIVYATEANLFIKDPNQSPFNVGTVLTLADFTLDQVAELNRRYDSPLRTSAELQRYYQLVGGNPFLVRRGLQELKARGIGLSEFEGEAEQDDGPFGDHLRRILVLLAKNPSLRDTVRQVLNGQNRISDDDFRRLKSAGVMVGETNSPGWRCQIYATFLKRHLL